MAINSLEKMKSEWWYYTVQLHDKTIMKGMYPDNYPFPPRMMQRKVDFNGANCLDLGSAEGLLPILAAKRGASSVVAVDHANENLAKLNYLAENHGVEIAFHEIGQAANLGVLRQSYPNGFDYINVSGLLYHVTSPIDVLAVARSFLKPNGLTLVSTICTVSDRCLMEFNDRGRFQQHWNVFWYLSAGFYEYMLRMLLLDPIDMIYFGDDAAGYASVLCRAADHPVAIGQDEFMGSALDHSMEFREFRKAAPEKLARSSITLRPEIARSEVVTHANCSSVNMFETLRKHGSISAITRTQESRLFLLSDVE